MGNVFISGVDMDNAKALQIIETIANDPEVGAIYKGSCTHYELPLLKSF